MLKSITCTVRMALVVCPAFWLAGCSDVTPNTTESPVRPAKLVVVSAASDVRVLNFPAVIEASTSVNISFQVGGLLQDLPVKSGQMVEGDTLIARLDLRDFENQVAKAQAKFDSADSEYRRRARLLAEDLTSKQDYERSKSERDVAQAVLDTALKQLEDGTLTSPFDGVIAAVYVEEFENVAPNEKVVTLQTTGTARATVDIPAIVIATSGQYDPEETVVILDAAPEVRIPAVLGSISTEADAKTQTYRAKFDFALPEDLVILAGMTGTVQARSKVAGSSDIQAKVSVPVSAILSDGDNRYVWVVDENTMTVSRRNIVVAPDVGESLPVLEGLEPGEVIVGAGASYLHEGARIRRYEP